MIFSASPRTDASPKDYSEPSYAHFNRRAGHDYDRMRDLIEAWAARLPQSAYVELQGRMQSGDNNEFDSAFFELYVHELLVRTGHAVTPQYQF